MGVGVETKLRPPKDRKVKKQGGDGGHAGVEDRRLLRSRLKQHNLVPCADLGVRMREPQLNQVHALPPSAGRERPSAIAKARSAASGLEKT